MLIHERLHVSQQRVVLTLDEVDFLLENVMQFFLGSLVILVVVLILVELSLEIVVINLLNNIMVGLTDSSKRLTALDGSGLCPSERGLVATF